MDTSGEVTATDTRGRSVPPRRSEKDATLEAIRAQLHSKTVEIELTCPGIFGPADS